ncbi:aldolase [Salipiger sp.]|uniref:aldolase n=1 Tax=Salipiger sp. TaxID=2078585 RepID=UPI003A9864C6
MAHELTNAGRVTRDGLDTPEILEAKRDLAACLRMAARLGLQEGICNHFSALVPGHPDLFMVNPYGLAFEEVRAADVLICDFDGNVLAGEGRPEATAFYIHARLHKMRPGAVAAFHTHMPYATALAMTEGEPLVYAGQSSLKFYGRVAVDAEYNGLALDSSEGDRIAQMMGAADILFMQNHGVMVVGNSIAQAWDDLYYLERAAEAQVKAMSTGRALVPVPPQLAEKTARQIAEGDAESARLHLLSVRRILSASDPSYETAA